jgi:hypothetical protein
MYNGHGAEWKRHGSHVLKVRFSNPVLLNPANRPMSLGNSENSGVNAWGNIIGADQTLFSSNQSPVESERRIIDELH